jgi:hypothetical protein
VCDLKKEVFMFFEMKCEDRMCSQLEDDNWKIDPTFPVDIMGHFSGNFSVILQGKDKNHIGL